MTVIVKVSGSQGPQGVAGEGVPVGGTTGQVLKKASGTDYDTTWSSDVDTGITQLTGDVTAGPGSSSQAATIANDAVTNAKLANVDTQTFKGRTAAGTGDPEDLTIAQAKALLNLSGTNTGDQNIELTGDVTGNGTGVFAATIANDAVTNAKLANMGPSTIKGRSAGSNGDPEDLSPSQAQNVIGPISPSNAGFGADMRRSASTVTGTQNDFSPSTNWVLFTGPSPVSLTGIVAQPDGQEIVITNFLVSGDLTIVPNSGSSSPANRFYTPNLSNIVLHKGGSARFRYSNNNLLWIYAESYGEASATSGGVLTAGTQTIAGAKTFLSAVTLSSPLGPSSGGFGLSQFETIVSGTSINNQPITTGNLHFTSASAKTLTGLSAPATQGTRVILVNSGAGALTLKHESGSSLSANRFFLPDGGADFILQRNCAAEVIYDGSDLRWVLGSSALGKASASANGYLTAVDFATFDGKLGPTWTTNVGGGDFTLSNVKLDSVKWYNGNQMVGINNNQLFYPDGSLLLDTGLLYSTVSGTPYQIAGGGFLTYSGSQAKLADTAGLYWYNAFTPQLFIDSTSIYGPSGATLFSGGAWYYPGAAQACYDGNAIFYSTGHNLTDSSGQLYNAGYVISANGYIYTSQINNGGGGSIRLDIANGLMYQSGGSQVAINVDSQSSAAYLSMDNGSISLINPIKLETTQTNINGSVGGSLSYYTPFNGTGYKKVILYLGAWDDAGLAITHGLTFLNAPYIYGDAATIAGATVSTTQVTLPAYGPVSGYIILEGF